MTAKPISVRTFQRYMVWVTLLWTGIVGLSLQHAVKIAREKAVESARNEARTSIRITMGFRNWAGRHGGVYVTPDAETPPNPYLAHVPDRDLVAKGGKRLTLMNPSYMLRQLMAQGFAVKGRFTSLNPLNPANAPDAWETAALRRLEADAKEAGGLTVFRGERGVRIMAPLVTAPECLKCHGVQGYKVGDLRGGIDVFVPLAPYLSISASEIRELVADHGFFWVLGLVGLMVTARQGASSIKTQQEAEAALRNSEERFRDLASSASDWFWETDADYRLTFVSNRIASALGVKPSAVLGNSFFDIGLGDGDAPLAGRHRAVIQARQPFRDVVFHVGPQEGRDSRVIRVSGLPVFDSEGEFTGYRGIGIDITREALAEGRAKLAQRQLADAIESIVDAIAVYDADDQLVIANRNYQPLGGSLGRGTSFETILRHLTDSGAPHADGLSQEEWFHSRLANHRTASGQPFIFRLEDRWILSREYRTRDGGVVEVCTDITALKRNEAELDVLRRRYQLILDAAGEGILGLDCDGRITFANRMACSILGAMAQELVGGGFHDLVQPRLRDGAPYPADSSAVRSAYHKGTAEQVRDDVFWTRDGADLHVDYLVAPIREDGRVEGAVVVFRDAGLRLRYEQGLADQQRELERLVSEGTAELRREVAVRARTEEALRASRERLKAIADSLFEGVLVIDRGGQLMFANGSARSMLGWEGDIEGHPLDGLLLLRQQDSFVDFAHSPWRGVVAEGNTWRDDDAVFATASGIRVPVAYACAPLKEEGAVRGAIVSFRDIQSLKEAQREAVQSSRLASVGQLAAGIAHEINTPIQYVGDNLRFIQGMVPKLAAVLEAARNGGAAEVEAAAASVKLPYLMRELPVAIDESLDGVAQIARIVLSMKEFSHPGTSTKIMADLNHAIENTLTVSRNAWKHVATVEKALDPALPPVLCFLGELNQVFLNLIVNAAHAIEASGKPLPGTLAISTAQVGDEVEIKVADSGTGIPDAILDRIFDPFFTTKEVGKGTGQGLAICRDVVVTKHGGRLDVDGRPGQGAIFTIRLPIGGTEAVEGGIT